MIILGVLLGYLYMLKQGKKNGLDSESISSLFLWCFFGVIAGGKVFLIFENPAYHLTHMKEFFVDFGRGFVFYGSFLTTIPILIWWFKKHKLNPWEQFDNIGVSGALVHGFGKIGCLLAGCCYGLVCQGNDSGIVYTNINAMANPTDRKAQEAARFEMECSEAAQEAYGRTAQGVMLPAEVMANWNQRDMSAGSDGDLIGEDYRGQDFIDVLRNNSAVMPLATNLNGLSGDVKIPKKSAASTAAFISSEGGAAGESEMTIGNISLTPKTLGAFTDVTRQLMIQSSLDIENLIRQDLAAGMAIAIDDACLEGDGNNGKPTGITNTTGINTVSLTSAAAPTWPEMVSLESAVGVDNALLGRLSYIVNPSNYGTLKSTSKDTGSGIFIADGNGMNGYPVVVSNQLTANNYVFGNFSDLLIGFFGGLDLVVDPYTSSSSGTVRVVALQSVDAAVRNPVSFVVGS